MALWFDRKTRFDIDYFDLLRPLRQVTAHPRYRSGCFRSEKCGREIQYESGLELDFVRRLERDERVTFYWDQPVRIPYWRGRRKVLYTPDFGIYLDSGHIVLAEVKDPAGMLDYEVQRKAEALMAFCSQRGFGMLLTDGRHTPRQLLKGPINRKLERLLRAATEHSPLRGDECRRLLESCGATTAELYKAVVRLGLRFRAFPMKIQRGNDCLFYREVFFRGKKYETLCDESFPTLFPHGRPDRDGKPLLSG